MNSHTGKRNMILIALSVAIAVMVSYVIDSPTQTAQTVQVTPLSITTTSLPDGIVNVSYSSKTAAIGGTAPYTWSISGGSLPAGLSIDSGTGVISGTPATTGAFVSFTIQAADSGNPRRVAARVLSISLGSSGSILVISSLTNPFGNYLSEILRTEGFSEFAVRDISSVSFSMLSSYDVVILGEMALTSRQVTMLSDWINAGGNLIAMRPDKKLAGLLGLTDRASTMANTYLRITVGTGPGKGIVHQTIQFHGTADLYDLDGASDLATLYSNATTRTSYPAVTLNSVGTNGGQAAAFTYDLARSVVYTRQGNPAWSGQERDGDPDNVIRSDDLFYGNASFDPQPDWVDLNKVAIPQADEQQRLLANLVIRMNFNKKPLPRFWYLPRNLAAAVVMTSDDHGKNGTAGRFDEYLSLSPSGCSVENWECIRGTSYLYTDTPLTNSQAASYVAAGFEVGLHVTTNVANWTPSSLESFFADQLSTWSGKYTGLPSPVTNRTHAVVWSDYATHPVIELAHGIRLDTNYYYWPAYWVNDRPGFFTGSGMPMRFSDANGKIINVYQATTQMTDESGQTYPYTIDTLLDRATGPDGYYGIFVANMHNDVAQSSGADAIVASARARGIPVVSALQMLTWLDGRNASAFSSISRSGNTLRFSISVDSGAQGLVAMVPVPDGTTVSRMTYNGRRFSSYDLTRIKGIQYARFLAANGNYQTVFSGADGEWDSR